MLTTIALGAGVQSTTMALMAMHGEIEPTPDCAIFADTQDEPAAVYRHLDWLSAVLPWNVHRVSQGRLSEDALAGQNGRRWSSIPFRVAGSGRAPSMLRRNCTRDYKIRPIMSKLRELLGLRRVTKRYGVLVEEWIGISRDEALRAKPSRLPWIRSRFPLLELGMTREDCLDWLDSHRYPRPPKSACVFCPFHSDDFWLEMKSERPDEWEDAVRFDRQIREKPLRGVREAPFLHRSLKPLDGVDFERVLDSAQTTIDDFLNECEGRCGV